MNTLVNDLQTKPGESFLYGAFRKATSFLKSIEDNKEKHIAENLNKKYNDVVLPPIWPDKIALAERFGIQLKNMPKNCISFLDKRSKIIYLTSNSNLLSRWENFAIAHVLGRWFLGHDSCAFDPSTITSESASKEDHEANKFASYLLIPDNFVHEYSWLEEDFARVFRVPQQVVQLRMSLG